MLTEHLLVYLLASEASLSLVMSIELEIYYIYIFIYIRASALVIWIYGKTERRIDKKAMPDECNFDSVTYALKLEARDPFRGVDSIVICWRQESNDSRFCSLTRLNSKGD